MTLIDNAVYVDGIRVATPVTLDEAYALQEAHQGFAWIGLYRPSDKELASVATEFDLHPLAIEDATGGHQRSKVERYGDTLFIVLRPARYDDEHEQLDIGELHLFAGPDFLITSRHAESPDLSAVRRRLEAQPELLALGSEAVLYAVLDRVVAEYEPVVAGIENDIDEIEDDLFGDSDDDALSRRIYELSGELVRFARAASDRGQSGAERAGEEDLVVGGHHLRADAHRHRVRHELRRHAGAALGVRLPGRAVGDDRVPGPVVRDLQAPPLAVTGGADAVAQTVP